MRRLNGSLTFDRECVKKVVPIGDFSRKLVERESLVLVDALELFGGYEGAEVDGSHAWAALLVRDDVWAC